MIWKKNSPKMSADEDDDKAISIVKSDASIDGQGNKIYFYDDVTKDSVLSLTRKLDETIKQSKIVQVTFNLPSPPPIEIHISSDGGDVFAAMAIVDKIANSDVPIYTYCEGLVASAATLISLVGHKRFISKNSCMLIHQLSSELWGNYEQLKDEMANTDLVMELLKKVYLTKTKLDEPKLVELLKHDLYLPAEQCQMLGMIDVII